MRIDQHSSGAINPELKKVKLINIRTLVRFFSIYPFLNCPHDLFVGLEMTFIDILFSSLGIGTGIGLGQIDKM